MVAVPLVIPLLLSSLSVQEENLLKIREYVSTTFSNVDADTNNKQAFDEIDSLVKNFDIKNRLKQVVLTSPGEYQMCARSGASKINEDIYTLVEYYSVSNDFTSRGGRMLVSGDKRFFLKQGLSSILSDIDSLLRCYN